MAASFRADGQPGGPRPRQLIITIYALYARDEPNWLSIASLVRLMADLGVESQAVRSSVARLKRRGLLISMHRSGTAGYALSPTSLEVLREGDVRIFGRHRAAAGGGWVLVVFSVPESERDQRHKLRSWLSRLGFGTVAPGVWVAPGHLAGEVTEVLARRNLSGYVDIFRADHLGFPDLAVKVGQWWDLDRLAAEYEQFIRGYRPLAKRIGSQALTGQDAFREYVSMLVAWQRLPYLDPGLPLELLPPHWNGITAGNVFAEINDHLGGPAMRHAESVILGA
ncbi:MAG: phenylacetic acid degradation operon negative regulatory protein [Streptosporangiaceae bacterium]|nr:phenylacetic acid degradation operon negative regulatory protein [Streptosporangiaceae bacterium]